MAPYSSTSSLASCAHAPALGVGFKSRLRASAASTASCRMPTAALRAMRNGSDGGGGDDDGKPEPEPKPEQKKERKKRARKPKPAPLPSSLPADSPPSHADGAFKVFEPFRPAELPSDLAQLIHMRVENERKRIEKFRVNLDAAWAEREEQSVVVLTARVVGAVLRKWDNRPFEIELVFREGSVNLDVLPTVSPDMQSYCERVEAIVEQLTAWGLCETVLLGIASVPAGVEPYKCGGFMDPSFDVPISFDLGVAVAQFQGEGAFS